MNKLISEQNTGRQKKTASIELELAPIWETDATIQENNWIEKDRELNEKIKSYSPLLDLMVTAALRSVMVNSSSDFIDWKSYGEMITEGKSQASKQADSIRSRITKAVLEKLGIDKASDMERETFISTNFKKFLAENGHAEEAAALTDELAGCLPLMSKMILYKETAINTTIPNRILENFNIYLGNMGIIRNFLDSQWAGLLDSEAKEDTELFCTADGYEYATFDKGIETYNQLIRGINDESGIIRKGIISLIIEANNEIKNKDLGLPYLGYPKKLNKQILAPAVKSYVVDRIENERDLKDCLLKFCHDTAEHVDAAEDWLFADNGLDDLQISGQNLHGFSHLIYKDHSRIPNAIASYETNRINDGAGLEGLKGARAVKTKAKLLDGVNDAVLKGSYSITFLADLLVHEEIALKDMLRESLMASCASASEAVRVLEDMICADDDPIYGSSKVEYIIAASKAAYGLRSVLSLLHTGSADNASASEAIVSDLDDKLVETNRIMSKIKAFLTAKRDVAAKKEQITFGSPWRLAASYYNGLSSFGGNNGIIRMDGRYHYFILTAGTTAIKFRDPESDEDTADILTVNRVPNPSMTLPRLVFTKKVKDFFDSHQDITIYDKKDNTITPVSITREAYEISMYGWHKAENIQRLGEKLYLEKHPDRTAVPDGEAEQAEVQELGRAGYERSKTIMIDTCQRVLRAHSTGSILKLGELKKPEEYRTYREFCNDLDSISTSMRWTQISRAQIRQAVENKEALMFEIRNNNMYADRLHGLEKDYHKTTYAEIFLAALSDENLARMNLRLNSRPSLFYRPASVEYKIAHHEGDRLLNKYTLDGRHIPDGAVRNELKHYVAGKIPDYELSDEAASYAFVFKDGKKTDNLSYSTAHEDLVHKKSLSRDMYKIVFSYETNVRVSAESGYALLEEAREFEEANGNILSLSRNTEDLLYYTVTDRDENVLDEGSLNEINGVDFRQLLLEKTKQKAEDRDNWGTGISAETIKDSYLKLVLDVILKKALEYDSIIIVEHISDAKRRGYSKMDNQMFGKLVESLRNKMAGFSVRSVSHEKGIYAPGGIANPIQLAYADSTSWNSGYLQEESAGYTATMCPETGFVPLFSLSAYKTVGQRRDFFRRFDSITADGSRLGFSFDYKKFSGIDIIPDKSAWTVKAEGRWYIRFENEKSATEIMDIASYAYDLLRAKTSAENIVDGLDSLTGYEIDRLFVIFRSVIIGRSYLDGRTWYISPVTGRKYEYSRHVSLMMARKHRYIRRIEAANTVEDENGRKRYVLENSTTWYWVNSMAETVI